MTTTTLTPTFQVLYVLLLYFYAYPPSAGAGRILCGRHSRRSLGSPDLLLCLCWASELDGTVSITTVGVSRFVLCESGRSTPCLRMSIPEDSLAFRGVERQSTLQVTCVPPAGPSYAFVVAVGA